MIKHHAVRKHVTAHNTGSRSSEQLPLESQVLPFHNGPCFFTGNRAARNTKRAAAPCAYFTEFIHFEMVIADFNRSTCGIRLGAGTNTNSDRPFPVSKRKGSSDVRGDIGAFADRVSR